MKDKFGNKLTWKEYMERWKQGIQQVTPLQQINYQIRSTWIILIGIVAGIIICLFSIKTIWWLLLILVGAFGNTLVQQIGLWQKKKMFENVELLTQDAKEVKKDEFVKR